MTERASQATPVTRVCLGYLVSELHAVEVGCGCLRGCLHAAWPGERGQRRASGLGWGAVGANPIPRGGLVLDSLPWVMSRTFASTLRCAGVLMTLRLLVCRPATPVGSCPNESPGLWVAVCIYLAVCLAYPCPESREVILRPVGAWLTRDTGRCLPCAVTLRCAWCRGAQFPVGAGAHAYGRWSARATGLGGWLWWSLT